MRTKTINLEGQDFTIRPLRGTAELRRWREEARKGREADGTFVLDLVLPGDARIADLGIASIAKIEQEIVELTFGSDEQEKNSPSTDDGLPTAAAPRTATPAVPPPFPFPAAPAPMPPPSFTP